MRDFKAVLEPDTVYHIYNRANSSEKMFLSSRYYEKFLSQYTAFISPIADTFCYCLLPNHFHFLIRIKPRVYLEKFFEGMQRLRRKAISPDKTIDKLLSKQFSNFFSSYTQSFNKANNRMGSLFMKNYNRIIVESTEQFLNAVRYIHFNPVEARLCKAPQGWRFSSYKALIAESNDLLASPETVRWFGGMDHFKGAHGVVAAGGVATFPKAKDFGKVEGKAASTT